ncbi:hypothetical protein V496_08754 [Pseudogymnoascus sp. VKM F-4515 (FW-2607)]|nr:hypothetical protein V496_08754 [Pseudogymnoascus sp. VKM F-4515 (FW-2607)]KFY89514.1 hypothetical protein V498_06418 [Pseudogymnoascus sp. VKM F-4517 (FW-2822)]
MPIPSTEQLKAAASKPAPCKLLTHWTSDALSRPTTKRTGGTESTNTSSTAAIKPVGSRTSDAAKSILNAALLDGSMRQHFLAGERMSKALAIRQTHAVCLWQRFVKCSWSIIRNPKDLFDGCLPDFFIPGRRGSTERRGREMTRAELEEAGFAYGEDLDVLEMQGMKLMGWVAED